MRQKELNQATPVLVFYTWHCIAGHESGCKNGTGTFGWLETRCTAANSDSTGREVRADRAGCSGLTMTVDWVLKNFCLEVLFFSSQIKHMVRGAYWVFKADHDVLCEKNAGQACSPWLSGQWHSDSLTPNETLSKKSLWPTVLISWHLSWMGKLFQGFQVTTLVLSWVRRVVGDDYLEILLVLFLTTREKLGVFLSYTKLKNKKNAALRFILSPS